MVWKRDHIYVKDGKMKVKASRTEGETVNVTWGGTNYTLKTTNLGCATSIKWVRFPVYLETYAKITMSVLASSIWLLSPDDTQKLIFAKLTVAAAIQTTGLSTNACTWATMFLSVICFRIGNLAMKVVFILMEQQFGVTVTTTWGFTGKIHEYYVDGELVRTLSGKSQIDPIDYTKGSGLNISTVITQI